MFSKAENRLVVFLSFIGILFFCGKGLYGEEKVKIWEEDISSRAFLRRKWTGKSQRSP